MCCEHRVFSQQKGLYATTQTPSPTEGPDRGEMFIQLERVWHAHITHTDRHTRRPLSLSLDLLAEREVLHRRDVTDEQVELLVVHARILTQLRLHRLVDLIEVHLQESRGSKTSGGPTMAG